MALKKKRERFFTLLEDTQKIQSMFKEKEQTLIKLEKVRSFNLF